MRCLRRFPIALNLTVLLNATRAMIEARDKENRSNTESKMLKYP